MEVVLLLTFVTIQLVVLLTAIWKVEDRLLDIVKLLEERLPNDKP